MLPGLAQSWITVVLCTLPFMANRGTGRGEEGNQHTRGPALFRLTWDQPTSAFSPPGIERRIGLPGVVSFGQPCPRVGFAHDDDACCLAYFCHRPRTWYRGSCGFQGVICRGGWEDSTHPFVQFDFYPVL